MIERIKTIVREAAQICLNGNYSVSDKGSVTNVVTTADVEIQQFLQKKLTELIPGSSFFGEESEGAFNDIGYTWVVDPIDGTQNFIRNLNQSSVSVGLCLNCEAVAGVVFNPFTEEMFWAEKGKGAFCNGKQLFVSEKSFDNALFCTAMSLYDKRYAEICNNIIMETYYKCNDVRRFGTASLELCYLAAGKVDLYYEFKLFPWDYAAATVILSEAGGIIEDPFIGNRIEFYHKCPVVAANSKQNLDILHAIVRKHMKDIPYLK